MVPTGTSWGEQNSNQHHPTLPHSASRILGQLDPTDTIMGGGQYLSARPAPLCLVAVAGVEIEALCSLPWQGGRFLAGVWLEWGKYFQRGVCSAKLPCSLWLQGFSLGLFFLPMPVGGSGCTQSRMYGRQRESLGTHCHTLPVVPRSLSSSLHLSPVCCYAQGSLHCKRD